MDTKQQIKKKARKEEKEEISHSRLRMKIKSYDHKIIDNSVRQIIDTIEKLGAELVGPIPLPTEIHKYTVNRSTFIHKNSREQFEMRVHKRIIDILNPNQKLLDALVNLNLPAGVDVEIKMV